LTARRFHSPPGTARLPARRSRRVSETRIGSRQFDLAMRRMISATGTVSVGTPWGRPAARAALLRSRLIRITLARQAQSRSAA
jgi:hypothetical protein